MVEIYNRELLEKAGLVAICDADSVTIYTIEELTNGFNDGDIIVKKKESCNIFSIVCYMCRYRGIYDGRLNTDAFYIKRKDGTIEKHNRLWPLSGLGNAKEYRLATQEEKEFFNKEMETASYIDY